MRRALERDPAKRPQTAREFESELHFIALRQQTVSEDEDSLDEEASLSSLTEKAEDLIALCRHAIDAKGDV
jgi:hypothetical protein